MAELLVKREIRKRGSFSDFAQRSGLHVSSVSQIANGKQVPYPGQIKKIVKTLEWKGDIAELFHIVRD